MVDSISPLFPCTDTSFVLCRLKSKSAALHPPRPGIIQISADSIGHLLCNVHQVWYLEGYKGGSYGNKILYKNLDLTQYFLNKISFHFLWVKMLPKNLPKIFRWPEMCPLDKILAQDFQMAAFTKILGRRDTSVVPLLPTENCKTLF